jgi:hypothetical protein
MLKKYKKKPIEIEAFQFTMDMHKDLVKMGWFDKNNNPTNVEFDFIKRFKFQWNQHTQQLLIDTKEGQMVCEIWDMIIKEPFDKKRQFYPVKEKIFNQTYDYVECP